MKITKKEVLDFKNSKEYAEFENYYNGYNVFKQIGLFRFEDFHTNILKSLFEPDNIYGLDLYPIKKLFELIVAKDEKNLLSNFIGEQEKIYDLKVDTQVCKKGKRVDLLISFMDESKKTFNIIIENKILSEENGKQCQDYYGIYGKDNEGRNTYIYLSLETDPVVSCPQFICITYQQLFDYVIEPCSYRDKSNGNVLSLNDYLASYSQFYDYMDEFCLKDGKQVLPLTTYGKQLTLNLYNSHKDIVKKLLNNANSEIYSENEQVLRKFYYNLFLISSDDKDIKDKLYSDIKNKIFHIRCTFNDKEITYKECSIKILEYLIKNKYLETEEDLQKLNICMPNKNYFAAKFEENIPHEEFYTYDYKGIGELVLEGKKLFYYTGPMTKEELKQYRDAINNTFNNVFIKNNVFEITD
jgi:hypothetical protein